MRDVERILSRVMGPFDGYCAGCPLDPSAAYVTAPVIGIGTIPLDKVSEETGPLEQTLAFDRAESEAANLTQINLVTVSSFNGVQGLLLGYDILPQEVQVLASAGDASVLDATPLLDASKALLGSVQNPRFPIAPGQHVLCAAKSLHKVGPAVLYGAIAIGIPEKRDEAADLFLEDHGFRDSWSDETEGCLVRRLVDSVHLIGENVGAVYRRVFVGLRHCVLPPLTLGCVLTAIPYLHVARNAVPDHDPFLLAQLPVSEWETRVRHRFIR